MLIYLFTLFIVVIVAHLASKVKSVEASRIFLCVGFVTMVLVASICNLTNWSIEFVSRGLSSAFFFASVIPFYVGLAKG